MKTFKVPATLEGVSTLKDGGLSVRFHTQELSPDEKTVAFNFQQAFGWLLFQEQDFKAEDLDMEAIRKDTRGKTPSQRMRNVLYLLYKQSGQSVPFEVYYGQIMEELIELLKARLEG